MNGHDAKSSKSMSYLAKWQLNVLRLFTVTTKCWLLIRINDGHEQDWGLHVGRIFCAWIRVMLHDCGSIVILDCFSYAASCPSELQWPIWHWYEAPGWVPAPLGQEASSSGGAPASRRLPLKHSCLWAVVGKCKTKTPFVLLGPWMCEHGVETQLVAQCGGHDGYYCAAVWWAVLSSLCCGVYCAHSSWPWVYYNHPQLHLTSQPWGKPYACK